MREMEHNRSAKEFSLHLTLLSSDMIKSSIKNTSKISVSCDISEVPKVNCTIIFRRQEQDIGPIGSISCSCLLKIIVQFTFRRQEQDIGPIGSIKFQKNRPIASATINLSEVSFGELKDLLRLATPPRPASFFLNTSKYAEGVNGEVAMRNSGLTLEIFDLSWRFPLL